MVRKTDPRLYYEKIKKEIEDYKKLREVIELYRTDKIKELIEEYYEALKRKN